jgi:hypothetical protein
MSFGFQGFESDSSVGKDNSISRYFSTGNKNNSSSSLGIDFSSILQSELDLNSPINQKLDTILQRLENNQPLINVTPEQAGEHIFKSIEKITSGIYEVFNKNLGTQTPAMNENSEELDRLLTGAKELFDRFEMPFILEELGETWKKLKKRQSPDFHSIHSYFQHIGISFLSLNSLENSNTDYNQKNTYAEDTYNLFADIVDSLPDSSEKNELINLINLADEYNPDELSMDNMIESSDDEFLS